MNDNMQDILKNYYASGGKILFESEEQLAEAPIPSYGNVGSNNNKFDQAGAEKYPLSTSQKIDNAITVIAAATAMGFAGKGTWDFFDPSTAETMVLTGIASAFAGMTSGAIAGGIIGSMSDHSEVHNARQEFSKQLALQVAKEKPEILKDIAGFKKSFLNSTPTAIIKQSIELANILYAEGEMQDYVMDTDPSGRFAVDPEAEPIMFGSDSDTAKRSQVLINIIGEYIAHYDDLFDSIAEKHGMTDQDLGAFLYHVNNDQDLVKQWFDAIKQKAGLTLS